MSAPTCEVSFRESTAGPVSSPPKLLVSSATADFSDFISIRLDVVEDLLSLAARLTDGSGLDGSEPRLLFLPCRPCGDSDSLDKLTRDLLADVCCCFLP